MTRIDVDRDLCELNAICAAMASDVFEMGDDELVVLEPEVNPDRLSAMATVVACCPRSALRLEEDR